MQTDMRMPENKAAKPRKRNNLTKRLPRMGKVVLDGNSSAIACPVREFSDHHAVLTMSGWLAFPSEFTLYVEPDSIRAHCRITKRRGSTIEVGFTEVEHGARYKAA